MIIMWEIIKFIFGFDFEFMRWGPGVHLHIANKILENEEFEDNEFLKINREFFLYGSVSPDITLGKKYIKDIDKHCHKWETAKKILENSKNDREKSIALGYITHLASDVIAHNFYIPKGLMVSRGLKNFTHTAMEIKVDMIFYKETENLIRDILKGDFSKEDIFIKNNISKALLPFALNRKIFEISLRTSKSRNLYRAFNVFSSYENWIIENKKNITEYHEISYNLAVDILKNKENSIVMKYDPNGEIHINSAKNIKKEYIAMGIEGCNKSLYKIPEELKLLGSCKTKKN
jgi:hypothetical protein